MNDYKDLIEDLRLGVTCGPYRAVTVLKSMLSQAADAIEQLVSDRNASVDALKALVENIDAVPVVRCKDCKHCYVNRDWNVSFNECELNHEHVQADDWFCADGERKGGDE